MDYKSTIQKLQVGINKSGAYTVLYNVSQFYSREQKRPINMYIIKLVEWNDNKGKNGYTEVFKTAKQLYIVFFLRNLWYHINNKPYEKTDFPDFENMWNAFKEEFL